MKPTNIPPPSLQPRIDTHHCRLSAAEIDKMQVSLDALARQVENFPVSDLHILVEFNNRSNDYSVKTSLLLPGATLVSNDHDAVMHAAFERCLRNLVENLTAYKERMGNIPERQKQQKHTHQELEPSVDPDPAALDAAVSAGDYTAFRTSTYGYEEALRKRAGRWVERYPEVAAQIGKRLEVSDLVEEVFLLAFEQYPHRSKEVRFGDWLESLLDPAVKALQANPDQELENINLARSAVEAEHGPGAV